MREPRSAPAVRKQEDIVIGPRDESDSVDPAAKQTQEDRMELRLGGLYPRQIHGRHLRTLKLRGISIHTSEIWHHGTI